MEPRIQYAKTEDGVNIAYWTLGEGGIPYVWLVGSPFGHIQKEWQIPLLRSRYEALALKRKLVRYDRRGGGLSQRDVTDFSLDALVLDLEAVVNRLGLESFVICAGLTAGPVGIAYTARHPLIVSRLILVNTYARGASFWALPRYRAIKALREADWDTYVDALAHMYSPDPEAFAAFMRESMDPGTESAFVEAALKHDVTALLPQVSCPTLVLYGPGTSYALDVGIDSVTELASGIPDARLMVVEDDDAGWKATEDFLADGEETAPPGPAKEAIHTLLFTDMEGSTTLTQRLGDAQAQEVLHTHNTIVRDSLKAHDGSEIKHTGDGIMASFGSARRALQSAITIQRAFADHNADNPDAQIHVRVGLNAGEPVAEDDDLFGTAVQLAARLCAHAQPGQIVIPDGVRHLVAGKDFLFADLGLSTLKGFEDPVRLFEVLWD